eukprot:357886-Chlamydomonas_euryale.AAC.7
MVCTIERAPVCPSPSLAFMRIRCMLLWCGVCAVAAIVRRQPPVANRHCADRDGADAGAGDVAGLLPPVLVLMLAFGVLQGLGVVANNSEVPCRRRMCDCGGDKRVIRVASTITAAVVAHGAAAAAAGATGRFPGRDDKARGGAHPGAA